MCLELRLRHEKDFVAVKIKRQIKALDWNMKENISKASGVIEMSISGANERNHTEIHHMQIHFWKVQIIEL